MQPASVTPEIYQITSNGQQQGTAAPWRRARAMALLGAVTSLAQAASYVLLTLSVHLAALRRAIAALAAGAAARAAAAVPALRPALAALCALPVVDHVGSRPRAPTVLGVAVAEEVADADWPAAVEALGRLLEWCVRWGAAVRCPTAAALPPRHCAACRCLGRTMVTPGPHLRTPHPSRAHGAGFGTVLLYEPAGRLQQPHRLRQLELQLLLQRLNGAVHLQLGWQRQRQRVQPGSGGGSEPGGGGLTAVLLAAADGEWPLLAAASAASAAAGPAAAGRPQQQQQEADAAAAARAGTAAGAADGEEGERAAAIEAAIAAPARLKQRLQAAAGPLAGCEPDFVLVRWVRVQLWLDGCGCRCWMGRWAGVWPSNRRRLQLCSGPGSGCACCQAAASRLSAPRPSTARPPAPTAPPLPPTRSPAPR